MTKPATSSQVTDETLNVRTQAGDAFRALFEEHYDYVFHSLRRLGVQTRDLEDLAHDVFVSVYENFSRYDRARPARPWLFAFAFRFASDYRRLARHRTTLGVAEERTSSGAPDAEAMASKSEGARIASRALEQLSLDQRAVFILYEIDEVPMKEIAASLAIPVNTAYSRLRLARDAFAAAIAPYQEAKGGPT